MIVSVVPACADGGDIPDTTGVGARAVIVAVLDAPPPGPGLMTCTFTCPGLTFAGNVNVSVVEFPKPVCTGDPLTCTCDVVMKPDPVTVIDVPPAAVEGFRDEIAGTGFAI